MTVHNFSAYTERTAGTLPASVRHAGTLPSQEFKNHLSDIDSAENSADTGKNVSQAASTSEDTWSFWDIIDVINPLQHIPVVSTLYRAVTGDEINNTARIVGGAIFGGVAGAAVGVANAIVDESTGKDIGENVFALLKGEESPKPHQPNAPSTETNTLFAQKSTQEQQTINVAEANIRKEDIIWASTEREKLESPPLEHPTPTLPNYALVAGTTKPATLHSNVTVDSPKGIEAVHNAFADMARNVGEEFLSPKPYIASHTIPNNPKAQLREAEEISLPPELIAQRMMEALDKYSSLKKNQFSAFSQL